MDFSVYFRALAGFAVNVETRQFGLNGLDRARSETGVHLDPSRVSSHADGKATDPIVALTEMEARQAGGYEESCRRVVETGVGALNRFVSIDPVVNQDSNTGEIKGVMWVHTIDKAALIRAWLDDGAPSEWLGD